MREKALALLLAALVFGGAAGSSVWAEEEAAPLPAEREEELVQPEAVQSEAVQPDQEAETDLTDENFNGNQAAETEAAETEEGVVSAEEPSRLTEQAEIKEPEKQKYISFDIEFTGGAERAVIGDTLWTEITFRNYGDDFTATGRWLLNGNPVPGFTNEQFTVYNGKTSAFPKYISEDFWDWGEINIGFEVLVNGESFYRTQRTVAIWNIPFSQEEIDSVLAKVTPVRVEAWLNQTANLYSDVSCTNKIGTVKSGTKVICINSKTGFSNQISLPDGRRGWVRVETLNVSSKNYTQSPDLSNWDKNIFVNAKGYSSTTEYLIWINLGHQRVNVFKGSKGNWSIEGAFPCASGRNVTPTITGVFQYYEKQAKWPYPNYYVAPVMIFSGNYAMHSVLLSNNGGIYDGTLGRPASNGCVRLAKHHIDWMAENIPLGTTVVVY